MAEIYGTTGSVPGDSTEVRSGGTTAISAAFETTAGLVGGMDTANGSATPGDLQTIESTAAADAAFGQGSELAVQTQKAFLNGAGTVYAVGVAETEATETVTGSQSGVLSNVPLFDIRVQDEHTIDVTDTSAGASVTVNMSDASPPATPTDSNTVNINPNTGEFEADASSDYEFVYTYGDYESAIDTLVQQVPRSLGVLTENTSTANYLLTQLNQYDQNFDFIHGVVGASPDVDPTNYSDTFDDRRLSVVTSSRAYVDSARTDEARTVGGVVGKQAGSPLGDSTTYESLAGYTELKQSFTNSELGDLIDAGVYPLANRGGIKVVKDMTTSQDPKFERVAFSEITDEVTEISHRIAQNFLGDANTEQNRILLEESHRSSYRELESDDLLDAYLVRATEGANKNEVDLDIGVEIVGYMDHINVTVTVGDVVTNGGAA